MTQVIQGIRAPTLDPQRTSFVLELYEDDQTSEMSKGDLMKPARRSSPKSQSRSSGSVGKYCAHRMG